MLNKIFSNIKKIFSNINKYFLFKPSFIYIEWHKLRIFKIVFSIENTFYWNESTINDKLNKIKRLLALKRLHRALSMLKLSKIIKLNNLKKSIKLKKIKIYIKYGNSIIKKNKLIKYFLKDYYNEISKLEKLIIDFNKIIEIKKVDKKGFLIILIKNNIKFLKNYFLLKLKEYKIILIINLKKKTLIKIAKRADISTLIIKLSIILPILLQVYMYPVTLKAFKKEIKLYCYWQYKNIKTWVEQDYYKYNTRMLDDFEITFNSTTLRFVLLSYSILTAMLYLVSFKKTYLNFKKVKSHKKWIGLFVNTFFFYFFFFFYIVTYHYLVNNTYWINSININLTLINDIINSTVDWKKNRQIWRYDKLKSKITYDTLIRDLYYKREYDLVKKNNYFKDLDQYSLTNSTQKKYSTTILFKKKGL